MIKIRIRNDDHEIDLQFPISENKLLTWSPSAVLERVWYTISCNRTYKE